MTAQLDAPKPYQRRPRRHPAEYTPARPLTAAAIFNAIRTLRGRATPPQIRRILQLEPPCRFEPDHLVLFLETMRQRGELAAQWDRDGNLHYRLPGPARGACKPTR